MHLDGRVTDSPDVFARAVDPLLAELAHAYEVATEYWDWRGVHVHSAGPAGKHRGHRRGHQLRRPRTPLK